MDDLEKQNDELQRQLEQEHETVQVLKDENMAILLELHTRNEQLDTIKSENKQLIDRWLAFKDKEAERMNLDLQRATTTEMVGMRRKETIRLDVAPLQTEEEEVMAMPSKMVSKIARNKRGG
jgi:hypothetical protein